MKSTTSLATALALTLTAPAVVATPQINKDHEPIELELKYQSGKTYTMLSSMRSNTSVPMGEQVMDQRMTMDMTTQMKVSDVDDSKNQQLETSFTRVAMRTEVMGTVIEFDSDVPDEANPMFAPMLKMVNKPFTVVVDENHEVVEVTGLDEMLKDMGAMGTTVINKDTMNQVNGFDVSGLLPGKPVKAGDTWDFEQAMPGGAMGQGTINGTYKLEGTTELDGIPCAVISFVGTMDMDLGEAMKEAAAEVPEAAAALADMKIEVSLFEGAIVWDMKNDYPKSYEMDMKMNTTIPNPMGEGPPMIIPSTTSQSVTTEIK
ncbi:DUF6263 family protein [Sulfuriroseicoccus oceanibius]|uniref:DUF4412 domain-containing protein n=1 Tax=Sulfuriroseicoccus oceanibius TaxID=2707525 RepID=A0A6B3L783_9BACT|nr:DUF6263 family protein [Sulfuriroseicoccus oceanibius]QQL44002.1 hypothetical protein G3M56_008850 [Sulfuriroseicoccus oceanibius]